MVVKSRKLVSSPSPSPSLLSFLNFIFNRQMIMTSHTAGAGGHWSKGLLASMNDPEMIVDSDDKVVIIKDKYPKARYHFLILPREQIQSLKALQPSQTDILKHMHKKGEEIAYRADRELRFRLGYHAIPSMSHLHMHVISQDFNSPWLKTKKHWNSFTSSYFVDSDDVMKAISSNGKWSADTDKYSELLKQDLRCHMCKKCFPTIPSLKAHIVLHDVAFKKS